jgi:hypothetical protein
MQGSTVSTTGVAFSIEDDLWPGKDPIQKQVDLNWIFQLYRRNMLAGQAGPGWYWCAQFHIGRDPIFHMLVVREDGEATPQGQYPWTCVGLDKEKILSRVQKEKRRNPVFYDALLEELMKMGEWPVILA